MCIRPPRLAKSLPREFSLLLACGSLTENPRIKWLLWDDHVHFDCAGLRRTLVTVLRRRLLVANTWPELRVKMRAALLRFVSCMLKFPDDINTLCCILFSWHVWFASVSLNFTSWMSTCPQSCSRMNTFPTLFGACCRCNFSCVKYLVVDGWNPHDVHFFIDRFGSHTGAKILLGVVLFPFSLVLPSSDFVWQ